MNINQGHWTGATVDPGKHIGFVYIIRDRTTGQAYVGRKQVWMSKSGVKGCKSRTPDRGSPKWKQCCWRESDWRVYSGSSKSLLAHFKLHPEHEYEYEVLRTCATKGRLSYEEAKEQWKHDVLDARLSDGSYKFFNGNIQAIKFRPKSEETT